MAYDYDLLVIGSGPGGYVAAIRAAQLGLKTAIFEKESPGGVCLNWGCIPSKSMIHQAEVFSSAKELEDMGIALDYSKFDFAKVYQKTRKAAESLSKGVRHLIKKNKIELISTEVQITGQHQVQGKDGKKHTGKYILIATGSRSRELPGFKVDGKKVFTSREILEMQDLPKRMLILGSGAIGMEFAYVLNAFGVEVHVVEILDRILPLEDREISKFMRKVFEKRGMKFSTETKAKEMKEENGEIVVKVEDKDGKASTIHTDRILVAIGRVPNSENLGLANVNIQTEKGYIPVKDYYQTRVKSIFAIGDVIASPLLAHVASKEGEIAVEYMAGEKPEKQIDPLTIPAATYCQPQVASFGYSEEKAKEAGIDYKTAVFPYRGAGKSVAVEKTEGMVKIIIESKTQEILGAHIAGADATELIHELLLARSSELLPEDISKMIHAHPTLSEAVMEAMRAVEGWVIHA